MNDLNQNEGVVIRRPQVKASSDPAKYAEAPEGKVDTENDTSNQSEPVTIMMIVAPLLMGMFLLNIRFSFNFKVDSIISSDTGWSGSGWSETAGMSFLAALIIFSVYSILVVLATMKRVRKRRGITIFFSVLAMVAILAAPPTISFDNFREWSSARYGIQWKSLSPMNNNRAVSGLVVMNSKDGNSSVSAEVIMLNGSRLEVYSVEIDRKLYLYDATQNKELPIITKP